MKALNENIFSQYNKWKTGYVRKENSLQMILNNFLPNDEDRRADTYHISEDGKHVDCDTDVYIRDSDLIDGKFPFPFGKVNGHFSCAQCENLTSLVGAPQKVNGQFNCVQCDNLTSLEGAPKEVGGVFNCRYCENLKSLEGAPKEVGSHFSCERCPNLTSLKGAPKIVNGGFNCSNCKNLKSLEGAPEKIVYGFDCHNCISLKSLKGLSKKIGGVLFVDDNLKNKVPSGVKIKI